MSNLEKQNPLIAIVGPTGVGKTELSILLAEKFNGEILCADSRTLYKGMEIGTAKPSPEIRSRVPHHLLDVTTPDKPWSLTLFQDRAKAVIQDINERGKLPFLVGGSGQYFRSVTQAWTPPAVPPDPRLRAVLEHLVKIYGLSYLYKFLSVLDPQTAEVIDPNNSRRLIRALEVIFKSGKPFSAQRNRTTYVYNMINVGLTRPRPELYERVDKRVEIMFSNGLVKEVEMLLAQGYSADLPAMSAIGYLECIKYITGQITLDQAITEVKRKTRIYIRRQANWFKPDDPTIKWFNISEENTELIIRFISSKI